MKNIKQIYNHKVKYPGGVSFYQMKISVGANARNKQELKDKLEEIMPGVAQYFYDRGFIVSTTVKAMPSVEE